MSFKSLLAKTKRGETLTEQEVEILAKKLGLEESLPRTIYKMFCSVLVVVVCLILLFNVDSEILRYIIIGISVILLALILIPRANTRRIVSYLETVKEFYIDRLCEFEGFESVLVQHQYMRNGYLQNNLALFITDGYKFFIFDDFLTETSYRLPRKFKCPNNKRPMLKIFDSEFVRKRPVCFPVKEIAQYQMLKPYIGDVKEEETLGYAYRRYTFSVTNRQLTNYCLLELTDGSSFKLSPEIVVLLRKKVEKKEIDGD